AQKSKLSAKDFQSYLKNELEEAVKEEQELKKYHVLDFFEKAEDVFLDYVLAGKTSMVKVLIDRISDINRKYSAVKTPNIIGEEIILENVTAYDVAQFKAIIQKRQLTKKKYERLQKLLRHLTKE